MLPVSKIGKYCQEMNSETSINDVVGQFAETELRKFYRAAEIGSAQVIITDCKGIIEYVNPAFSKVSGYSYAEAVGKSPSFLKSGRMSATFYERLWDTLLGGAEWNGEFFNRRKDGTYFHERAVISPIKGNDGEITHFIKVADDITLMRLNEDRHQRQIKLIESINIANVHFIENGSLSKMAGIILETCMASTNSPFGIILELLPNGNAVALALLTTSVEPATDASGYRDIQYEILRHGSYEVPLHNSLFMAPIIEKSSIVVNSSEDNHWKSCSCRLCSPTVSSFAGFPLKVGSSVIGMIGLANCESGYSDNDIADLDIFTHPCSLAISSARAETIRKATQEQLKQSQKMEAIGQLAGGIAHDFNNLLTVMNGYSTLAIQKIGDDNPARKDLEQVLNAGERATTLIRQLLGFGRRQVLDPKPVQVNTFISGLHKILSRLIGENIILTTNLANDVGQALADPSQIEQIIMNLVINARDAMERGGRITIETANAYLDSNFVFLNRGASEGPYVMISVRDTGMGMSEEVISRIFEPFFTTKKDSGTGLGLATVYGIVKQSNGYIQVLSELGLGSEFRVYLPRVIQEHPESESNTESKDTVIPFETEGMILVVEDEQTVLDFTAAALRSNGYDVLTATGPIEALKYFDQYGKKIELILSDVMMPDISGPEMAMIMLEKNPNLKIVFMTGYADVKFSVTGINEESLYVIIKPFSTYELSRMVHDCLRGKNKSTVEQCR